MEWFVITIVSNNFNYVVPAETSICRKLGRLRAPSTGKFTSVVHFAFASVFLRMKSVRATMCFTVLSAFSQAFLFQQICLAYRWWFLSTLSCLPAIVHCFDHPVATTEDVSPTSTTTHTHTHTCNVRPDATHASAISSMFYSADGDSNEQSAAHGVASRCPEVEENTFADTLISSKKNGTC